MQLASTAQLLIWLSPLDCLDGIAIFLLKKLVKCLLGQMQFGLRLLQVSLFSAENVLQSLSLLLLDAQIVLVGGIE